jgi:hypothetical protein
MDEREKMRSGEKQPREMRETGWSEETRFEEDQNEVLWSLLVDLYTGRDSL